jgi:hypothetical protein
VLLKFVDISAIKPNLPKLVAKYSRDVSTRPSG